MTSNDAAYPAPLLRAVAERRGRIVLVLGAGCSHEEPTGLSLARVYSEDVHRQLVEDGLLASGECSNPSDLSALSTAVYARHGSQRAVVERLPLASFRLAAPNDGYLIAAALLREGAVSAVLTLNFDLAMTNALIALGATEVTVVPGPEYAGQMGAAAVIYLHRNVDEPDSDSWILRVEALNDQWRGKWEEVVASRVMASPVVVFAGLGSPAAVLTETLKRVRAAVVDHQQAVFVVDPFSATTFQDELDLAPEAHVQAGWGQFMARLALRLSNEMQVTFESACRGLCEAHVWTGEEASIPELAGRLHSVGLVALGRIRATWLIDRKAYARDDERRELVADLLLGVGLAERATGTKARFLDDGVVQLYRDRQLVGALLPVSGGGVLRWAALEPRVLRALEQADGRHRLDFALVSGASGPINRAVAPPVDLLDGDSDWDIVSGNDGPAVIVVDDLRADPSLVERFVS